MQNYIINSTANYPAGFSQGKKVFKVPEGQYAGRTVILMTKSPGPGSDHDIRFSYADYPYNNWSNTSAVITDCDNYPFDAVMDSSGNIYAVYTKISSHELMMRMLTFTEGSWAAQTPVTIYNADDNYYPSIVILATGRFYVSWSRYSSSQYYVQTKYSDDVGATWGSGPSDVGTALSSGVSTAYSKMIVCGNYLYSLYSQNGSKLSYRRKVVGSGSWESEADIAAGSGFDENFAAAVSSDNRLAAVYDDGQLRYKEYDGIQWSGVTTIDSSGGDFPQLKFFNNNPYAVYLSDFGSGQVQILYSGRTGQSFGAPENLDLSKSNFEKVLCFNASSADYDDLTTAASNSTAGDVYHADSMALLKDLGDALYFGMTQKFYYTKILLSSAGVGGQVNWQYYDGANWVNFTPSGGAWHFTSLNKGLLLWNDYNSILSAWQKNTVVGSNLFWIRAVVSSAYATGAVGSQITSIADAKAIVLME